MTKDEFDARYRVQHIDSDRYVVFDKVRGKIEAGPLPKYRADGVLSFMRQHCHG